MADDRIHRAVSADGTQIGGRVHGHGPALVLVHGGPHDGDLAWGALVPYLADRFTCYLPSIRGRGLSADSPDLSPPRLQEDISAYVDSIGEPVFLVGWSGIEWTVGAAAHSGAVAAVALYESNVGSLMREDDLARMGEALQQGAAAAADGRLVDASRAFHRYVCTDKEMAVALETDYFDRCASLLPAVQQERQRNASYEGPRGTDPEVLRKLTVPVLLLRGQETRLSTFVADSEQYVAQHVADPHVREPLPGLGHFAPVVAPEPVAKELISFFESVRKAA